MQQPGWYADPSTLRWWDGVGWSQLARTEGVAVPDGSVADPAGIPAPGWYPDPLAERWWDGSIWTSQTREIDAGVRTTTSALSGAGLPEPGAARSRKRGLLLTLAAVAAFVALAAAASLVLLRNDGGDANELMIEAAATTTSLAAALDPPVGALDVPTAPSKLLPVSGESQTISVATCPGLLVTSPADDCVQIEDEERSYAMTLSAQDNAALIDVFEFVTSTTGLTATKLLSGTIESPELQPNSTHTISVASAPTAVGPTFVLQSLIEGDSLPVGDVEFIAIGGDGELATVGVVTDDPTAVGTADGYVFVTADRFDGDDPCCASAALLTTIYPIESGWKSVAELLDPDEADRRTSDITPVAATASVVFRGPTPVTTTTLAPAPTTAPPATPPAPQETVDCDGSWLTVVASPPLVNVGLELDSNPGSRVLKADESCQSLSPTFSTGTYAGQSIFIVFYGPFATRFAAQEECLSLGKFTNNACYAAPLTNDPADRSVRFGPTD